MDTRRLETALAWFSLVGAGVHFLLETLYHIQFGQFLPLLLVDYVTVGLLVYSGTVSLRVRPSSASGLLCGAWGFAACLAYVAFFAHLQVYLQGEAPLFVIVIIGVALAAASMAFLLSLRLVAAAMRKAEKD
ncbi:hypothetical protein [Pseudoxanthomonas putridarboris]|uniref:Uncharacterized protein n=1 Tax=Pseudoxanthomonas putridarboris TaxID=752605 RepID=A0ABU9J302_9GAMM